MSEGRGLPSRQEQLYEGIDEYLIEGSVLELADEEAELIEREAETPEVRASADAFYEHFDLKMDRIIGTGLRRQRTQRRLRVQVPRIARAAAIIVAVLALGISSAAAFVPAVRVAVMQLFANVGEKYAELELLFDPVPGDWRGEYYPTYIPAGYEVALVDSVADMGRVFYIRGSARYLRFYESVEAVKVNLDTEDSVVKELQIHGNRALLMFKEGGYWISWAEGTKFLMLFANETEEETVRIAESVKPISKN